MFGGCGSVLDYCHFKSALNEIARVRLDAQIGGHAGQNNLANAMLAQLRREIVVLRAVNLVWSGDNSTSVLNIWLELIQPVGTGEGFLAKPSRTEANLWTTRRQPVS